MEGPVRKLPLAEVKALVGTEVGVSDWIAITQPMINAFAELTGDTYFIHVNPERAAKETPFGGSIAHGFLTLSMLANMAYQANPSILETKTGVNYGFNKVRFISPVPAGSRVRGRFKLLELNTATPGRWTSTYEVTVEIEGAQKPALVAEWLGAGLM